MLAVFYIIKVRYIAFFDFISKELKISNYECKKLYSVCDNFSLKSLCYFVDLAYSVEADLKSKNRDIDLLLELLISKMSLGGRFE